MSILSTEEYQRKGFQIDLDMLNLDSLIQLDGKKGVVPPGKLQTWNALLNEWGHFFEKNIKSTPILPVQDSGELDLWLNRHKDWLKDAQQWAQSGDTQLKEVSAAMPESPAVIEHRENPPSTGLPAWAWMAFGVAMTTAVGYTLASAARLGGR
jgi:hypothetical protein